jgi:DNA ligase (NAD+)
MDSNKINKLEKLLTKAQKAYYNSTPIMSDAKYDSLFDHLKKVAPDSPVLKQVGATPTKNTPLAKVKHTIPMGSQNKVVTEEEFDAWAKKTGVDRFVIQEKLDGLSVELVYKDGKLRQAITRGDGATGEDITHNVVRMRNVEKTLAGFTGSLRGEIILFKHHFEDMKKKDSELKTPRNVAAGIARRKTPQDAELLEVLYHDILADGVNFKTEKEKTELIKSFLLSRPLTVIGDLKLIKETYKNFVDSYRARASYEIDGMVVKVNSLALQEEMGEVHGRPKGQVAWKFEAEEQETTLKGIEWELGLTGRLTPVAMLEPVQIGGVTVSKASLHTWSNIVKLGLHHYCSVLVSRRGDVIPQVEEVTKAVPMSKQCAFMPIRCCPVCDTKAVFVGEFLTCPNLDCPAKLKGDFQKWIKTLEMDFLGEAFIDKLFDEYDIKGVWHLYTLTVDQIAALPGFAGRSAQRIFDQIHSKKSTPLVTFLGGLNIPNVSTSTFQALFDAGFDEVEKLKNLTEDQILNTFGIGDITAKQITLGLKRKWITIEKLLRYIQVEKRKVGSLTGMSFCFTGEISIRRGVAQKIVTELGGTVKSSVVKGLTYLVQADPTSQSGKSQKANQYGVKIISGEEFMKLVNFDMDMLKKVGNK